MPQTKPIVDIVNVVASASVDQKIDLVAITKEFPDVEYHPEQFPGLVFRLKSPKTATLISAQAKWSVLVPNLRKRGKCSKHCSTKTKKRQDKNKKESRNYNSKYCASVSLGGKVHLEKAARSLPRSMYEPEQFPGLIHRMLDPRSVVLIFASGKLVCTGTKKEAEVYRAVHNLHTLLEEKKLMEYE